MIQLIFFLINNVHLSETLIDLYYRHVVVIVLQKCITA